jgi:hypothetical protein
MVCLRVKFHARSPSSSRFGITPQALVHHKSGNPNIFLGEHATRWRERSVVGHTIVGHTIVGDTSTGTSGLVVPYRLWLDGNKRLHVSDNILWGATSSSKARLRRLDGRRSAVRFVRSCNSPCATRN